ncbi:MAG TPA: rhomboid family intramembrane serine protease [Chryseolinea sp.]|nr:rhomboid family intramembrane serine protease [Chryseolinea sp.]
MIRLTPVVRNLIIINVIVFLIQKVVPVVGSLLPLYSSVHRPDLFQPYQLFTYMFAHGDFMHIFFNMLMLAFFGPILEEFWGQKRFLLFYMVAGIGAGIFNILMDLFFGLGAFHVMLGASGAVYGVMTAFGIIFPNMELRLFLLPISFKAKYMVMVLGSLAIYYGFRSDPSDNTAHLAHLGGIVVAIILIQIWRGRGT